MQNKRGEKLLYMECTIPAKAILFTKSGIKGKSALEIPKDVQSAGVPATGTA